MTYQEAPDDFPLTGTFRFMHPDLGLLHVAPRRGSGSISVRQHDGYYRLSVPYGIRKGDLDRALKSLGGRLATPTVPCFADGHVIKVALGDVHIHHDPRMGVRLVMQPRRGGAAPGRLDLLLTLGGDLNLADPLIAGRVSEVMSKGAGRFWESLLQARVRTLAATHGVTVRSVSVGHGRARLGACSSAGDITISRYALFLPQHLLDYIICHELAHRTHLDHSAAFHSLVNRYTEGRESALESALRGYAWPLTK